MTKKPSRYGREKREGRGDKVEGKGGRERGGRGRERKGTWEKESLAEEMRCVLAFEDKE